MKIDTGVKLKDVEQLAQAIEADAGQEIDGLREALIEGANGDFSVYQVITPEQVLIKQAHSKLKLNQRDFVRTIKTSLGTLRD